VVLALRELLVLVGPLVLLVAEPLERRLVDLRVAPAPQPRLVAMRLQPLPSNLLVPAQPFQPASSSQTVDLPPLPSLDHKTDKPLERHVGQIQSLPAPLPQ
jgi:hypothetical protein